jgi:hypothetical protein
VAENASVVVGEVLGNSGRGRELKRDVMMAINDI